MLSVYTVVLFFANTLVQYAGSPDLTLKFCQRTTEEIWAAPVFLDPVRSRVFSKINAKRVSSSYEGDFRWSGSQWCSSRRLLQFKCGLDPTRAVIVGQTYRWEKHGTMGIDSDS